MANTTLVTCRSVLFDVKIHLFAFHYFYFFIILVFCQGAGGVPGRFCGVPGDSG